MTGRASVWSSPELRALAREFVPTADEVWRLQRGTDGESRFFQSMADEGHYRKADGTRQGIYVMSPGGQLLSSINKLDPKLVKATLEEGLARWKKLPPEARSLPADVDIEPTHRWEQSCPDDGLRLTSVVRDLPWSLDPNDGAAIKWNRDHVWFTKEEARRLLPRAPKPGDRHDWPAELVGRLAQFHLVDNVIGQTLPFAPEEVAGSTLTSEVLSVDGNTVTLALSGRTEAVADGSWKMGDNDWKPKKPWPRGMRTSLVGTATYDLGRRSFTDFELVAQGLRWGRAVNNGRREGGPSPMGWVFRLAGEGPDGRVPPAFVDVYASWIRQPPNG